MKTLAKQQGYYSRQSFWSKVKRVASKLSKELLLNIMICWFALQDKNVPYRAKVILTSALAYFILPWDGLPDPIYTDDFGVVLAAISVVMKMADLDEARKASAWVDKFLD